MKKLLKKMLLALPHRLPVGMTEFETWASSIIDAYDLPDNESVRFSLASMILHLNSTDAFKPRRHFALCMLKGMASQIAQAKMQEYKENQAKRIEEEAKKKAAEEAAEAQKQLEANASAITEVASNESKEP